MVCVHVVIARLSIRDPVVVGTDDDRQRLALGRAEVSRQYIRTLVCCQIAAVCAIA